MQKYKQGDTRTYLVKIVLDLFFKECTEETFATAIYDGVVLNIPKFDFVLFANLLGNV